MKSPSGHALIIGGGIVGVTTAWRLSRAGLPATLFRHGPLPEVGVAATHAAAGMLAPSAEMVPGEHDNYLLQRDAPDQWRRIRDVIVSDGDARSFEVHETGTLLVGWDAGDRRYVDDFRHSSEGFGITSQWRSREDFPDDFIGVSERITSGLFLPHDAWVDPDEVMASLCADAQRHGLEIVDQSVLAIGVDATGVTAETSTGVWHGDRGLLATGAHPLPLGTPPTTHRVRPVRGFTIRISGFDRANAPTLRAVVHTRPFYMVARQAGKAVLGASAEEKGVIDVEVGELNRLLRDALDVVPALETATIDETRVGLRPAAVASSPFLEVLDGDRWAWSSGHYRHGVTMAPKTSLDAVAFLVGETA